MTIRKKNEMNRSSLAVSQFEIIARVIVCCCALAVIAYCIWTLDRGFEITDEAYYLLMAIYPSSQKLYISAQHWISAWLWQLTGSIIMFRASGMIILIMSSTLLALGVFSSYVRMGILENSIQLKGVVIAASVIGALLYGSTINFSPCYNLLASAGAYSAAGLILFGSHRSSGVQKYIYYFLAGGAIGMEVLCKASAGISTLILLTIWLCIFERSCFHKISALMVIFLGIIVFISIALVNNSTISETIVAIKQGLQMFRLVQMETIDVRLIRYIIQFGQNIMATLVAFGLPLLFFSAYAITHHAYLAKIGGAILLLNLFFGGHYYGGWNAGQLIAPPIALFAMLIMVLLVSIRGWYKSQYVITLYIGLLVLPYSVAMGTGNTLFTQIIITLAPWTILIAGLLLSHQYNILDKMTISLIGVSFITTVTLQIITSGLRPYHLSTPLIKQNQIFTIPHLGLVKVDTQTHQFLSALKAAAEKCNILPGTTYIGLYNVPGVALALQSVPMMSPWLNNVAQAEHVLEHMEKVESHAVIIVLNMEQGHLPPLPRQLKKFPWGYQYCGEATYPFGHQRVQIWKSQITNL